MMISPPPPAGNLFKYKTVTSELSAEFDKEINALLETGWVLYNEPLHYVRHTSSPVRMVYTQTMVKYR